jgi:hypothetical protein
LIQLTCLELKLQLISSIPRKFLPAPHQQQTGRDRELDRRASHTSFAVFRCLAASDTWILHGPQIRSVLPDLTLTVDDIDLLINASFSDCNSLLFSGNFRMRLAAHLH